MDEALSTATPAQDRVGRAAAGVDIIILIATTLGLFALEKGLAAAGLYPVPEAFEGGATLIGSFFIVWGLMRWRGQSWSDLGLRRPRRWWFIPLWGFVVIVVTIAAQLTIVPLIAKVTNAPPPDLSRYDIIRGNLAMVLIAVPGTMITGGFMEEVIYRGMIVDRLWRLFGSSRGALVAAALLNGLPFGLAHYAWGIGGILVTIVMGSVLGAMLLLTRRNLWPLIAAHASLDAILMLQVYTGTTG